MATRYTDNQRRTYGVVETFGEDQVEGENNGVWKARWTNIREGKREKRRETAEESIHSTTESVCKTPIDNNTQFHQRRQTPIQKRSNRGGNKEQDRVDGCAYSEPRSVQRPTTESETGNNGRGETSKGFLNPPQTLLAMNVFVASVYFLSHWWL